VHRVVEDVLGQMALREHPLGAPAQQREAAWSANGKPA
jgi:hypothetical protein